MSDRGKAIRQERESDYGPFERHFEATALGWTGLLIQMGWTPPCAGRVERHHVGLFFALDKAMREANKHKADNVDDGGNYLRMAGELAEMPAIGSYTYSWSPSGRRSVVEIRSSGFANGDDFGSDPDPRLLREQEGA